MSGSPPARPDQIFLALADLNPEAREEYLEKYCGGDRHLRAEVEAMLEALHVPEEGFLDPALIPALDMNAVDGPLQAGTVLGQFLVLHAIGSGGMGVVYAAQQEHPRRTVAIKVLRRGFRQPEIVRRFEREAEVLGRLQHPGIAQVFAFHPGSRQAPAHLVLELVPGPTITEYAQAQHLSLPQKINLMIMVCEAIQHAHERGVIHRDLKPANVLVAADGKPKVLDFGIARLIGLDVQSGVQTAHGQLIGTLAYMSPEQLGGGAADADPRSDVYALGVLLFRLLAGRQPFDLTGLPLIQAVHHILQTTTPMLGEVVPELHGPLESIVSRAMARRRDDRFQSAAELAADLGAYLEGRHGAPYEISAESPDERLLAIGLKSGSVAVVDARSGHMTTVCDAAGSRISTLRFNANRSLSIVWENGLARVVDLPEQL